MTPSMVRAWLVEREANARRLAQAAPRIDRGGWLEDAEYFRAAIELVSRAAKLTTAPQVVRDEAQKGSA